MVTPIKRGTARRLGLRKPPIPLQHWLACALDVQLTPWQVFIVDKLQRGVCWPTHRVFELSTRGTHTLKLRRRST